MHSCNYADILLMSGFNVELSEAFFVAAGFL